MTMTHKKAINDEYLFFIESYVGEYAISKCACDMWDDFEIMCDNFASTIAQDQPDALHVVKSLLTYNPSKVKNKNWKKYYCNMLALATTAHQDAIRLDNIINA